ncbi:MAG: hypothetical protein N2Z21_01280 [Candidatus Sumerlaeaceae bacterium]|nr:hypothetical protein [Candidatus Sumerlaeaceae bacterium]
MSKRFKHKFGRRKSALLYAWLAAFIAAHIAYAAAFIWKTSFVVEGERVFCLVDDAMVSMRYALNLARGDGWVWNPNRERVEGCTNPLWCLVMAAVHLLPLSLSKTSLIIQCLGELCLVVNLIVCFFIARRLMSAPGAMACVALIGWYFPLNNWALQGMEVGALALCVSISCLLLLRRQHSSRPSFALMSPSTVAMALRPDGVILHLLATVLALFRLKNQRVILAHSLLLFALVFGGWTVFRRIYYGDWLPNTYYLKMTGFPLLLRITRGAFHAAVFWVHWLWPTVFLTLALKSGSLERQRRFDQLLRARLRSCWYVPLSFIAVSTAYSIYVGGDAWERVTGANRFIAPAMPLAFVLLVAFVDCIRRRSNASASTRWTAAFLILFAINANAHYGTISLAQAMLIYPPPYKDDNIRNVALARWLDQVTTPRARVAIDYAGTAPYFLRREFIDLLGKSDRHVARLPAHRGMLGLPAYREFYPGHLKWDYAYSLGQLKPDVVCAIWRRSLGDALDYLAPRYRVTEFRGVSVYFRENSLAVLWEKIIPPPTTIRAE